jgi:hypothetical protein
MAILWVVKKSLTIVTSRVLDEARGLAFLTVTAMMLRILSISSVALSFAGCSTVASIEEFAHLPRENAGVVNVGCRNYTTYEKTSPDGGAVLITASAVNQAAASLCSDQPSRLGLNTSLAEVRYSAAAGNFIEKSRPKCRLVRGEALTLLHSKFEFACD